MNRVAVFAHYDKDNHIEPYVVYYIKELKKVTDYIVFVSDCNLENSMLKKLNGIVDKTIAQRHGEYDFGSYKRGYLYLKNNGLLKNCSELILANDSCFGPLIPFQKIWVKMNGKACDSKNVHNGDKGRDNGKTCDFWGITQYTDKTTSLHIQSYFLVFKKQVFSSAIFDKFMKSVKKESTKMNVVYKYEIGLSQLLISKGFVPRVYSNCLMEAACLPYLIYRYEIPFIKTMIVKNNFRWLSSYVLKRLWLLNNTAYDINLILRYALKYKSQNMVRKIKNLKRAIIRFKKGAVYICGREIKMIREH